MAAHSCAGAVVVTLCARVCVHASPNLCLSLPLSVSLCLSLSLSVSVFAVRGTAAHTCCPLPCSASHVLDGRRQCP